MTETEQRILDAIAANTSQKPAIVADLQESLAIDAADLSTAVMSLRAIGAINEAKLMKPGTPERHAIWPTGVTSAISFRDLSVNTSAASRFRYLKNTTEKPAMNARRKPGELRHRVTELLQQQPMTAKSIAHVLNTSFDNIMFLMRKLRQDGVASQDDNLCWRLDSSPVVSKRIEPSNPLPDKDEKPKARPTAAAAISRRDSLKNVPSAAEPASTQTAAPSFRFGAWDDDSLVIIGPESAIELPAEAARRLVVFLNHHFSQPKGIR